MVFNGPGRPRLVLIFIFFLMGLFSIYPASAQNAMLPGRFQPSTGAVIVDQEQASWDRGVPLGGIATGGFEILPGGAFTRIAIHQTPDRPVELPKGTFLAVSAKQASNSGTARILQVPDSRHPLPVGGLRGMSAVSHRTLFPFSEWAFSEAQFPLEVRVMSWSPLFPESVTDSAMPVAVIEISLVNHGRRPVAASVALSWEDLNGLGGSSLPADQWPHQPISQIQELTTGGLRGLAYIPEPHQIPQGRASSHYGSVFVGIPQTHGGIQSLQRGWFASDQRQPPWWQTFERRGRVDTLTPTTRPTRAASQGNRSRAHQNSQLESPPVVEGIMPNGPGRAGVVACRVHVIPGETRTVPFVIVWHMPNLVGIRGQPTPAPRYIKQGPTLPELVAYIGPRLPRWKAAAQQWQQMVLTSTLPLEWRILELQAATPLITHGILRSGSLFSGLEAPGRGKGMMGGLDLRTAQQRLLLDLYPTLDREELLAFASLQNSSGLIPRHAGNIHGGYRDLEEEFLGLDSPEATAHFVIQSANHYRATGDEGFREAILPAVSRAMDFLYQSQTKDWPQTLTDIAHDLASPQIRHQQLVQLATAAAGDLREGAKSLETLLYEETARRQNLIGPELPSEFAMEAPGNDSVSLRRTPWVWGKAGILLGPTGRKHPILDQASQTDYSELNQWLDTTGDGFLRPRGAFESSQRVSAVLTASYVAPALLRSSEKALGYNLTRRAMAHVTGRPSGPWNVPLFEERSTAEAVSTASTSQAFFQNHRASQPWWGLSKDLVGFAVDAPRGILYLDPPKIPLGIPGGQTTVTRVLRPDPRTTETLVIRELVDRPLEIPLFTARGWMWFQWDARESSGTLTCLKVPEVLGPGGRKEASYGPLRLRSLGMYRNNQGEIEGELAFPEEIDFVAGTRLLMKRSDRGWDSIELYKP